MLNITHSRGLRIRFIGPTNHKPSRVVIKDLWHEESVTLSLSGADMLLIVEDYLKKRDIAIESYTWTKPSTDEGILLVDSFDKRIK